MNHKLKLPSEGLLMDDFASTMYTWQVMNGIDNKYSKLIKVKRAEEKNLKIEFGHYTHELLEKTIGKESIQTCHVNDIELWSDLDKNEYKLLLGGLFVTYLGNISDNTILERPSIGCDTISTILSRYIPLEDQEYLGNGYMEKMYTKMLDKAQNCSHFTIQSGCISVEGYSVLKMLLAVLKIPCKIGHQNHLLLLVLKIANSQSGELCDINFVCDLYTNTKDWSFENALSTKKTILAILILSFEIYKVCVQLSTVFYQFFNINSSYALEKSFYQIYSSTCPKLDGSTDLKNWIDNSLIFLEFIEFVNELLQNCQPDLSQSEMKNFVIALLTLFDTRNCMNTIQPFLYIKNEITTGLLALGNGTIQSRHVCTILQILKATKSFNVQFFKIYIASWDIKSMINLEVLGEQLLKLIRKPNDKRTLVEAFIDFTNNPSDTNFIVTYSDYIFKSTLSLNSQVLNLNESILNLVHSEHTKLLLAHFVDKNEHYLQLLSHSNVCKTMNSDIRKLIHQDNFDLLLFYFFDFFYLISTISKSSFAYSNTEYLIPLLNSHLNCVHLPNMLMQSVLTLSNKTNELMSVVYSETQNPVDFWKKIIHFLFFRASFNKVMDSIQLKLIQNHGNNDQLYSIYEKICFHSGKHKGSSAIMEFSLFKEKFLNSILFLNDMHTGSSKEVIMFKIMQQSISNSHQTEIIDNKQTKETVLDMDLVDRLTIELDDYKHRLNELKSHTIAKVLNEIENMKIVQYSDLTEAIPTSNSATVQDNKSNNDYQIIIAKLKSLHALKYFTLQKQHEKEVKKNMDYINYLKMQLSEKRSL